MVLAVVQPERLPRLQDGDVEAQLLETPFALEVAALAQRAVVAPARLAALTTNQPSTSATRPYFVVRNGASGTPIAAGYNRSILVRLIHASDARSRWTWRARREGHRDS